MKSYMQQYSEEFHWIEHFNYLYNSNITFNETPLSIAACRGHFKIVELLLSQKGIKINCEDI